MEKDVFEFHKSEHFMLQQWNRGFDEKLIRKLSQHIQASKQKSIFYFSPCYLKKHKICSAPKHAIVVVATEKLLITIFWCSGLKSLSKKTPIIL